MSSKDINYNARVVYIRNAKIFPSLDHEAMELSAAVDMAIANHQPGEAPVIIGNNLQLIGIEAIRTARTSKISSKSRK